MRNKEKEKGEMKKVKGWWFTTTERKLLNNDGREIKLGITHKVKGKIIPCQYGLHLSPRILDALAYASGPVVYKVEGSGVIIPHGKPIDKYACSHRTYLDGGIDISDVLRKFANLCALDVIHLWDAPDVVVKYLKTGDESLREVSREISRATERSTERSAKRAAARKKQNLRLTRMVNRRLRKERRKEDERCKRNMGDGNGGFKCCY